MSNLETEKVTGSKKGLILKIGIPIVLIIILIITFNLGHSAGYHDGYDSATIEIDGKKLDYDQFVKKIGDTEKKSKKYEDEMSRIEIEATRIINEFEGVKEEYETALEIVSQKDSAANELKTIQTDLDSKKAEITTLDETIKTKNDELASVANLIKAKNEEPKVLPAGMFLVGKDIPQGRYKVTTNGTRGSNLFVYDSSGSTLVNTIISSRDGHGVKEYITILSDGYFIEANDTFKYIPVE